LGRRTHTDLHRHLTTIASRYKIFICHPDEIGKGRFHPDEINATKISLDRLGRQTHTDSHGHFFTLSWLALQK
jgi:hypothetical protein